MKSRSQIQFEYRQVISQADKLEGCAEELQSVREQINALVDSLRSGWAGESADMYYQKCSELSQKINRSRTNLDQTVSVIRRTAKAYRDAELAALRRAQQRDRD